MKLIYANDAIINQDTSLSCALLRKKNCLTTDYNLAILILHLQLLKSFAKFLKSTCYMKVLFTKIFFGIIYLFNFKDYN
jgi:hypothetical protein